MKIVGTAVNEAFTLFVAPDEEEASRQASLIIADQIGEKRNSLLCAASGSTPARTYAMLADMATEDRVPTDQTSIVKLDEWLGLPLDDPHTCESFQRKSLLEPLDISAERYIGFNSEPADEQVECQRIEAEIAQAGGVDIAILGIGVNGHIGLNEPADYLRSGCHVADLAPTTIEHAMLEGVSERVRRGITMGMRDILGARRILLLAFGEHKAEAIRQLLSKRVSTQFPASFLWLHPDVMCICDRAAAPQDSEVP